MYIPIDFSLWNDVFMIEQLFILGNGFDIAHRLPTGYKDFVHYIEREDASDDEKTLLDFLIHYIGKPFYNGRFLWKDFENKLGEADFSQDISNAEYREDQLYDEADKDPDYYAYQASAHLSTVKHIAASLPYIFEKWIRTVDIDEARPIETFRHLIRRNQATFLTFHYTKTLEEVYHERHVKHIHGAIDGENILVGHGNHLERVHTYEKDKINPLTELSSIDDINYTLRSVDSAYNSWSKNIKQNIIKNADYFSSLEAYNIKEVYSFGFSYNEIDMPYIKIIIDGFKNPCNVKWIFSDYNEDANQEYERILRNNDFKGAFARFHSSDD